MDGKNRVNSSVTTFINEGFLNNENINEMPNDLRLCPSSLGHPVTSGRHENGHRNRLHYEHSRFCEGIRNYALEHEEIPRRQQPKNRTKTKLYNGCIVLSTMLLLFAPIAISVYVFMEHRRIDVCASNSEGPSVYPSMQHSAADTALKKLVDEVKKLHTKYQQLRSTVTQSKDLRAERLRRHKNCSSHASGSQAPSQASLDRLEEQLTNKARQIKASCFDKLGRVNSKVKDIEMDLNAETSNCIFNAANDSKVEIGKNILKVQITENKNADAQLVGVTCCNEHNTLNVSNAILEVTETASNIVYACYCSVGQKCNICYWQCGDPRHKIK